MRARESEREKIRETSEIHPDSQVTRGDSEQISGLLFLPDGEKYFPGILSGDGLLSKITR